MSVDLNRNGAALKAAYEDVINDKTATTWFVLIPFYISELINLFYFFCMSIKLNFKLLHPPTHPFTHSLTHSLILNLCP